MKLLLDTHALLWWFAGDERLPVGVRDEIYNAENDIFASAVSAFEIAQKHRLGKLPSAVRLARDFGGHMAVEGFQTLPIGVDAARLAGSMPHPHRDPFDRLLVAQALTNGLTLVSNEGLFDSFGVSRLW